MKALIFNGAVMQVEETPFDVHPDFVWVDCSDDVTSGYAFADGVFTPPAPAPARTYAELRSKEYPAIGDQLDALWKGGDAASEMLAKVQAVKLKYPKDAT